MHRIELYSFLSPVQGKLTIRYNGLQFVVDAVSGDAAINNMNVSTGDILPG
jgi:hypothetical protein